MANRNSCDTPSDSGHHEVVTAVLVDSVRALLCHRHPQRRWYPNVWDLPGGHIEVGEAPHVALARELGEELGIHPELAGDQPATTVTPSADLTMHVWFVSRWEGQIANNAPEENDALGWFTPQEVETLELAEPEIAELVAMALRQK